MINNMLATANAEQAARALELARRHYQRARYVRACRMFSKSDSLRPLPPDARDQYEAARRAAAQTGTSAPAAKKAPKLPNRTVSLFSSVASLTGATASVGFVPWPGRRPQRAVKVVPGAAFA